MKKTFAASLSALFVGAVIGCGESAPPAAAPAAPADPAASTDEGSGEAAAEEGSGEAGEAAAEDSGE